MVENELQKRASTRLKSSRQEGPALACCEIVSGRKMVNERKQQRTFFCFFRGGIFLLQASNGF
jgi:hypothetical protein